MPHAPSVFSSALYTRLLTDFFMPHAAVYVRGRLWL